MGTFVGYPIDTIKVRIQISKQAVAPSVASVFMRTISQEGFFGLYKGIKSPLIGATPYATMVFSGTELSKQFLS